jgi:hypothetical protein
MSFWSEQEQMEFYECKEGHITSKIPEGKYLIEFLQELGKSNTIRNVVEIGTWNGLGSTKCILEGIQNTPIEFWSLECNKEKNECALENLKEFLNPNIHILHGSIINPKELFADKEYLKLFSNTMNQEWFISDIKNYTVSPNLLKDLPLYIDFLLLDGGVYTTLYEFRILLPRCSKYIALDDTNTDKNKFVVELLRNNSNWKEVFRSSSREGFSIFETITCPCRLR